MITLSNNTKGLALLHQVEEIYGKVYTGDSLLETVLYWGINCTSIFICMFISYIILSSNLMNTSFICHHFGKNTQFLIGEENSGFS